MILSRCYHKLSKKTLCDYFLKNPYMQLEGIGHNLLTSFFILFVQSNCPEFFKNLHSFPYLLFTCLQKSADCTAFHSRKCTFQWRLAEFHSLMYFLLQSKKIHTKVCTPWENSCSFLNQFWPNNNRFVLEIQRDLNDKKEVLRACNLGWYSYLAEPSVETRVPKIVRVPNLIKI